MVDAKRVERKLPLLITESPWYTSELDKNDYWLRKFKKQQPDRFGIRRNNILSELEALKNDLERFRTQNKNGRR